MTDQAFVALVEASPIEVDALRKFRQRYGTWWKLALRHKWASNTCHLEPNGDVLRRIGEELGPEWLRAFTLPK